MHVPWLIIDPMLLFGCPARCRPHQPADASHPEAPHCCSFNNSTNVFTHPPCWSLRFLGCRRHCPVPKNKRDLHHQLRLRRTAVHITRAARHRTAVSACTVTCLSSAECIGCSSSGRWYSLSDLLPSAAAFTCHEVSARRESSLAASSGEQATPLLTSRAHNRACGSGRTGRTAAHSGACGRSGIPARP